MEKITRLAFCAFLTLITFTAQAQIPEWFRNDFHPTAAIPESRNGLTTDSNGNAYATFKYSNTGQIYIAKFDTNGNVLWNDILDGATDANVSGAEIINNGGTDYLYIAFDSQTTTSGSQTPGLACYNATTGIMQWTYEYIETNINRTVEDFTVGADGSLILTCNDHILFLDKDGVLVSQFGNASLSIVRSSDITSTINPNGSPDADTGGKFTNTETDTPFSVGSPLAGTPAATDIYKASEAWTFGESYPENDPSYGATEDLITTDVFVAGPGGSAASTGFTGGDYTTYRSTILNDDGLYVYATTIIGGRSQQAIIKLNKTDKTTVEWKYNWNQYEERGAILADENGNIYTITWEGYYYLNSPALDILISKFDKNGNYLWSKIHGNGTNSGNEVIWGASAVDIDTTNQRIAINSYTDSFDSGTPKAAMLILNYDGELQNYSIVGETGVSSMFGTCAKFDSNGDVYGTGVDFSGGGVARIFKIDPTTVFNDPAPIFTSLATASVADDITTSTIVLDVQANDGDGGATDTGITYTISGDDAGDFNINAATGELTFQVAPDFNTPADADTDNEYLITVTADNGNAHNNTTDQEVTITVTDSNVLSIETNTADTKLTVAIQENGTHLILATKNTPKAQIGLYTLTGKELYNNTVVFENGSAEVSGLNLQKGKIYLLRYKTNNTIKTVKFAFN